MDTKEKTAELSVPETSSFSLKSFDHAQRVAKMLSSSSLVPKDYQNRIDNCMIALEMANRIGASPLMVMQNLHVIQGRPSWSSPFIIASLNSCGRFTSLRFEKTGSATDADDYGCEAWAEDKSGRKLVGPKVTWAMVKAEGWLSKPGSKWKTMPELMFMYRAAAFFGRLYAPDILMGMLTHEEALDVKTFDAEAVDLTASEFKREIQELMAAHDFDMTQPERDRINKILDENETASYGKVLSFLKGKLQPTEV